MTLLATAWSVQPTDGAVSSRMTKALLEKDGVNWRQKLPPIPTVPVSAQTRWSVPSAGGPGANTPPAAAPRGEPGESVPLGRAQSPVAQKGDEQGSGHTCLAYLQLGLRLGETRAWFCRSLFG